METVTQHVSEAERLAIDVAIHIKPDTFQGAIMAFVEGSALSFCTDLDTRGDDSVAVVPRWDPERFSTGEKLLWQILESLTEGALYRLADRGSSDSRLAVVNVVRALMAVDQ